MIKKLVYVIGICVITTTIAPVSAFAAGNGLPNLSTPKLPALKTPQLSTDYNKALEELKKQGFGEYKYDPSKELPLPEVEAPQGTGKSAFEVFKQQYGDMWNDPNRQLSKPNNIPNDEFFAAFKDFGSQSQAALDKIKSEDKKMMSELLKKKLDTSNQWDLNTVKKSASFLSASEQQAFLNSTPKPAGWNSVKSAASSVPSMASWLGSTPKAAGYGSGGVWDALNILDGIKGNFFSSARRWQQDLSKASSDRKKALDEAKQAMLDGKPIDKQKLNDAYSKELKTKLKPVTSVIESLKSFGADKVTKEMVNVYNGYQKAEKKYGKGNAVMTGIVFGKPMFTSKNSFIGKYIYGGNTSLPGYTVYDKNSKSYKYYIWKRNGNGVMAPVETDKNTFIKKGMIR